MPGTLKLAQQFKNYENFLIGVQNGGTNICTDPELKFMLISPILANVGNSVGRSRIFIRGGSFVI